jgi:hypothetical protein
LHKNLVISHDELKLAHEATHIKATSIEPHVDLSTNSLHDINLICASPRNSSNANAKSNDELSIVPCFSNGNVSSSTLCDTNIVEELKELKDQVTSLEKDLNKCFKGKTTLDEMLSNQRHPHNTSGLGFNSNNEKSKNFKKKGQGQEKTTALITCFKCKKEGHHVRDCPLKKKETLSEKQQGKRPQVQEGSQVKKTQTTRPRGQDARPQASRAKSNAQQSLKPQEKWLSGKTCYTCREKGHKSTSCPKGTFSKPPIVNEHYSLRKDRVGNVFAKYVGTQGGLKKKRAIWVTKPIVTNFLGPNIVGTNKPKFDQ